MFDLLLASGADVNLLDSDGLTPLMVAVYCATQLKAQWLLGEMAHHVNCTPLTQLATQHMQVQDA